MQVQPVPPQPISSAAAAAQERSEGPETADAHHDSLGAKVKSVLGTVKEKAKKLKDKIKTKAAGTGTTDHEHLEADSDDEGEGDQSPPDQGDDSEEKKGLANQGVGGDKVEGMPAVNANGTENGLGRLNLSPKSASKDNFQETAVAAPADEKPDEKIRAAPEELKDEQPEDVSAPDQSTLDSSVESAIPADGDDGVPAPQEEDKNSSVLTRELDQDAASKDVAMQESQPQGVSSKDKITEDESQPHREVSATDLVDAPTDAMEGESNTNQNISAGLEERAETLPISDNQEVFDPPNSEGAPIEPSISGADVDEGGGVERGRVPPPELIETEHYEDAEGDKGYEDAVDGLPAERDGERDQLPSSEPVQTDHYEGAEGEREYVNAVDGVSTARDVGSARIPPPQSDKDQEDGAIAAGNVESDRVPSSEPVETDQFQDAKGEEEGERDQLPSSEFVQTDQYEGAEGEREYVNGVDGVSTARDVGSDRIPPPQSDKDQEDGAIAAGNVESDRVPSSEPVETDQFQDAKGEEEGEKEYKDGVNIARDFESDQTASSRPVETADQYEDAEGDKGYKDKAYEGVTGARDTAGGAAASAAAALGSKAHDRGEERPLDEVQKSVNEQNLATDKDADSGVAGSAVGLGGEEPEPEVHDEKEFPVASGNAGEEELPAADERDIANDDQLSARENKPSVTNGSAESAPDSKPGKEFEATEEDEQRPKDHDEQPQLPDANQKQPSSPGETKPTIRTRAADTVLGLKDTLAATFGYGVKSPTSQNVEPDNSTAAPGK